MKKATKALLLIACAVVLVIGSVFGTLAYLTSTDEVKNTFTVGKVNIKLDEAVVDGETGEPSENRTEEGNAALRIIPGREIYKDPTVTVLGDSEACYVRMQMTVTWQPAAEPLFAAQEYNAWFNFDSSWIKKGQIGEKDHNEDGTYTESFEFWYKDAVEKSESDTTLPALFTTITIPGDLTSEQVASTDNSSVVIVAHAIQAEGFENAAAAWAAFDAQQ